jgi:LmbE family N-acetylglucosaminyl deacetylase
VVSGLKPNRIDQPGTAEALWAAWPVLPELPTVDPLAWPRVVVVAAHPDDEVLGVGGTIAILAAAQIRLRVIAVTDGGASHPGADPDVIGQVRAAERAAALAALGAGDTEVIRLRLPDTAVAAHEAQLVRLLREQCAGFDVCLAPWDGDAHADHEAAGRAARRAGLSVLSYPVWMWHWAIPADPRVPWRQAHRIPLPSSAVARKESAIAAFASQLSSRGPDLGPVLPDGIVAHFTRPQEVLLR